MGRARPWLPEGSVRAVQVELGEFPRPRCCSYGKRLMQQQQMEVAFKVNK